MDNMDLHDMFGLTDWSASPDDLFDSMLSINADFLKDLENSQNQFLGIQPELSIPVSTPNAVSASNGSLDFQELVVDNTHQTSTAALVEQPFDFDEFSGENATAAQPFDVSEFINFTTKNEPLSSSSSDSGLSSDNMDMDVSPDYEPLSPAMSSPGPSISERGGHNSPARSIVSDHQPSTFSAPIQQKIAPILSVPSQLKAVQQQPTPMIVHQKPKTIVFTSPNITTTNTKPRYIVEKSTLATPPITVTSDGTPKAATTVQRFNVQQQPKKELKIYKMTPTQNTVGGISGSSTAKKITIQMKDSQGKVSQHPAGTYVINKNSNHLAGVRKLVRVQNSGTNSSRSILLPVSFQDVKDFRTIKIINASNLNNKPANIKLAAANLLQQSKQGLVQKNVVFSKEQLIDDSMSDPSTSDAESYVFEDVMLQPTQTNAGKSIGKPAYTPMAVPKKIVEMQNSHSDADDDDDDDEDESSDYAHNAQMSAMSANGTYPKLMLTNEEKRLLDKEGITLPGNYPLTKHEERELKRIRRKIRNKISAQDSRKRKKEYVDGLEERVKQCTDENQTLIKRLKLLQSQHSSLSQQVKKLQAMLSKSGVGGNGAGAGAGSGSKTTQPATCLMVLLLSLALVAAPNLKLGQNAQDAELAEALQEQQLQQQNRRTLLFDTNEQLGDALVDEEMNLDDIMAFNDINEHDYAAGSMAAGKLAELLGAKKPKRVADFVDFDVDDGVWKPPVCAADNSKFAEKASAFQDTVKAAAAQLLNFEPGAKVVSTPVGAMFDSMQIESMDVFGGGGGDARTEGSQLANGSAKKLNESKVTGADRTLLLKGA